MRIIFIRHGDPDYSIDSLTEKGWREARLLAKRVSKWDVTDFYCSPLGRAKATASCTLEAVNRTAVTYSWLREFEGHVVNRQQDILIFAGILCRIIGRIWMICTTGIIGRHLKL